MGSTATTATAEVKICVPSDFTGERTKTNRFIQECKLYLRVNNTRYDTDEKKVIFALSFMNGGSAGSWKEGKTAECITNNNFGTWAGFKQELLLHFSPVDDAGVARTEIRELKQGSRPVEEYISEFRILAHRVQFNSEPMIIEYFMQGLNPTLLEKVHTMEKVPTTIAGWYKATSKFDGNYRRVLAIIRKTKVHHEPSPVYIPKARDPNAMDINRLTQSERNEHMKKGLCFVCHKPGHRSSDHKGAASTSHILYQLMLGG
jgi:hypothetical protein